MSAVGPAKTVGRYVIYEPLAAGGMATVHLGRLVGPVGFARIVAIKRMRADFLADPDLVSMFIDEARIAGRIRHPNIVAVNDVVAVDGELLLVMEYVHGETLARLNAIAEDVGGVPAPIAAAIVRDALIGLQAAHDARDERGEPLNLVHRDVSPQNVLVGVDGVARVLDFGVAKAVGRSSVTRNGELKGKLAYMAPEQLQGNATQATDTFAASIVLWESLTGQRLFRGETDPETVGKVLTLTIKKPSEVRPELGTAFDDVVMTGLAREPKERHASARDMALALGRVMDLPDAAAVGEWVSKIARDRLQARDELLRDVESEPRLPAADSDSSIIEAAPISRSGETRFDAETRVAPQPEPSSRRRKAIIALFVGGVAAAAAIGWSNRSRIEPTAIAPAAPPPSAIIAPVDTASAPLPSTPSTSAAAPSASASATSVSTAVSTTPRSRTRPVATGAAPSTQSTAKPPTSPSPSPAQPAIPARL